MPFPRLVVWLLLASVFSLSSVPLLEAQTPGKNDPPEQPLCGSGCNDWSVSVTPDGSLTPTYPPQSGNHKATFTVLNNGNNADTYYYSCSGTLGVVCDSVKPGSATIPANTYAKPWQRPVAWFHVTSGTQGKITVTASGEGDTDSGNFQVPIAPLMGPPAVTLQDHDGTNRDRGLCFTAGAGERAGVSCGDLFLVHGMPAYRTLGRDRSLSLYYNSAQAAGLVLVAANVSKPAGLNAPDNVKLILTVGTSKDSAIFAAIPAGLTMQYVLGRGLAPLATGRYPMTLEVRNVYSSGSYATTIHDTVLVVNRSGSEYGAGWSLLGVEQLFFDPADSTRRIWVAGDGSIRVYTKVGANLFRGAPGEASDSLIRYNNGGALWYRRNLKHGAAVLFDETGRHRVTENRVGAQTLFNWTTVAGQKRLSTITVPPAAGANRNYTFTWNSTTARLVKITDPGSRQLQANINGSNLLLGLTDPDNQVRRFVYSGNRLVQQNYLREGMKGDSARTVYTYAHAARLTKVAIQTDSAGTTLVNTTLEPWDEKGLATSYSGSFGIVTTSAGLPTRVDGPLAADQVDVWVNRYGAPHKITHAGLGTTTVIRHDSLGMPGLVTQVQYPHPTTPGAGGRIVRMSWNPRGNLTQVRDSTKFLDSQPTKVTTYTYADLLTPDSPTRVQDALGRHTDYTYNSQGLTSTITDPRGHVTTFGYQTTPTKLGLVRTVTEQNVQTWHEADSAEYTENQVLRMDYDGNGNPQGDTATTGGVTSYTADALGRITDTYDPLRTRSRYTYDAMNRVTKVQLYTVPVDHPSGIDPLYTCPANQFICADSTRAFNPAMPNPLTTNYYHSAAGTLDSISDPRFVNRTWRYDARGNVVRERDEFGEDRVASYATSGLMWASQLRSGHTTLYSYDNYGRLVRMTIPSRIYADTTIPGDTVSYTYDLLGRRLTATNTRGTITRTYYADGSVKTYSSTLNADDLFYDYDATGSRTRMIIGGRDTVDYAYSGPTGDLITITARLDTVGGPGAVRAFSFSYDALGRRRQLVYPSTTVGQVTVDYRYDAAGNLRKLASNNTSAAPGVSDRFDFDYWLNGVDVIGRRLAEATRCRTWNGFDSLQTPCAGAILLRVNNQYNRRGDLVYQKSHLNVDSLQYDASGNITRRASGMGGNPDVLTMTMLPKSNRLQQDHNQQVPYTVNHYYDANGADTLNMPTVGNQGTAPLWRWMYYDGLGRMSGYKQGQWMYGGGYISFSITGTACRYDADGQLYLPCANGAPQLSFDGPNVVGTNTDWRFIHAPGVDEPLMARYENYAGAWLRELYFVTDGQGRQLSVGDRKGYIHDDDLNTTGGTGWRYSGAARNASGFGAERLGPGDMPGVSMFRNRAYDSRTGRWTQEDPIGVAGGLNLYQFNGNDPVAYTDPFGLCPFPPSSCFGRQGADLGAGFIPIVSSVHDGVTLLTGKNHITGDNVGLGGRAIALAGLLSPASGGQIRGIISTGKKALSALIKDATTNLKNWRTVGAFTEPATSKAAKDGISVQRILENDAGDQLVEHTVLDKAGDAVGGPHFRPNYKPRDVDRP